jgi:DNA polymerase II small subunit
VSDQQSTVLELVSRLNGRVLISSDISDEDMVGKDLESLTAQILNFFGDAQSINILNKETLLKLSSNIDEKAPKQIEIRRSSAFASLAKDVDANFNARSVEVEKTGAMVSDFASYFNDRFKKLRQFIEEGRSSTLLGMINNIESLKQYTQGREVAIVGMVYDKIITKNGHVLITLEDETGNAKVLFLKSQYSVKGESLFDLASRIVPDEVIAVRGKLSSPFVMASSIVFPDIAVHSRKKSEEDVATALISDAHVGSKMFMENHFSKFLEWLNGGVNYRKDLARKIKYVVVGGDLVDGIGIYPNQDKELNITDIYKQYSVFFDFMSNIPDYIEVFILTGNHDAVQRAEPQPILSKDLIGDFVQRNVHYISNPGYLTLHGTKILSYHGTSLDSVIQGIPGCTYSKPEVAMLEILRRRHLSPIYGNNPIIPSKKDALVIDEIPDVLHMGHVHKNGYSDYHGTLIINSGTWQSRTGYQLKLGHIPTPAVVPVYEHKTADMSVVDFNNV